MVNCVVHLMGSHAAVDMITEDKLGQALEAKLEAMSSTYNALANWESAYVLDIRGEKSKAVDRYDMSITGMSEATSKWKKAEFLQSELIAYFTSLPKDLALRKSVSDALDKIDFKDHVSTIQKEGRFPSIISTSKINNMVDLGVNMFSVSNEKSVLLKQKDSFDEIVNMFMLDLHQVRELKLKAKETQKTLEDNKGDVERAQLFERVGSSLSIENKLYPLTMVTSQLRVGVVNYISYIEAYGSYVSRALIEAKNDDTWSHVKKYLQV